jgi:hypothetical protein
MSCRWSQAENRIVQPAFMTGQVKHVHAVSLTSISESLVTEGMVSAQDATALHAEMTRYADDQTTIVTWPRIVQAWAGFRQPTRSLPGDIDGVDAARPGGLHQIELIPFGVEHGDPVLAVFLDGTQLGRPDLAQPLGLAIDPAAVLLWWHLPGDGQIEV